MHSLRQQTRLLPCLVFVAIKLNIVHLICLCLGNPAGLIVAGYTIPFQSGQHSNFCLLVSCISALEIVPHWSDILACCLWRVRRWWLRHIYLHTDVLYGRLRTFTSSHSTASASSSCSLLLAFRFQPPFWYYSESCKTWCRREEGASGASSGKMLASARTVTQIRSLQLCFWPKSLDKPFFLLVLSTFCHSSKRPSQPLNLLMCTLLTFLKPSLKPWFSSSLLNLSSRDSRLSTSYHYNDQRNLYWVWRWNKKNILRYLNWYLFQWSHK